MTDEEKHGVADGSLALSHRARAFQRLAAAFGGSGRDTSFSTT